MTRVSSNSPASFCGGRGQQEEGLQNLTAAAELDPRNFYTLQQIAASVTKAWGAMPGNRCTGSRVSDRPQQSSKRGQSDLYELYWKGDPRAAPPDDDETPAKTECYCERRRYWFSCARLNAIRLPAERALVAVGDNPCWDEDAIILSRSFGEGCWRA